MQIKSISVKNLKSGNYVINYGTAEVVDVRPLVVYVGFSTCEQWFKSDEYLFVIDDSVKSYKGYRPQRFKK